MVLPFPKTLARLVARYDAVKREHLAAWEAVHGNLLACGDRTSRPPTIEALQRLARAQARRDAIEAEWAELMAAEVEPAEPRPLMAPSPQPLSAPHRGGVSRP